MLTKIVQYEDYNGDPATEKLYFNLNKTELMDLQDLAPRLESWRDKVKGDSRQLTTDEIRELLEIVKILIEKSYGVRSADGKRFMKSEELFTEFKQTAVYADFVFSLFEDADSAVDFITGIMPKSVLDQAKENDPELETTSDISTIDGVKTKPFAEYTDEELLAMSTQRFYQVVGTSDPLKMTQAELIMAMRRKQLAPR